MGNRTESRFISLVALMVFSAVLAAGTPRPAFSETDGKGSGEEEVKVHPVDVRMYDLELLDQDGSRVRFQSDVVGDRIVVIDTIFTTCGLICPILSAIFADVQEQLGDRLGKEVALVSISVDPITDIPPRLKEYAGTWEARPGWSFLTGEKSRVDRVLEGLGLYSSDFAAHPAAFLVGDGKNGGWTRYYGFATPEQITGKVNELLSARHAKAR